MGFIVIDYESLIWVTVFAFAAIGLSRGWLTEFINTVLLALLSILLIKPEILAPILEQINKLIKLILALLGSGFSLEPATLMSAYEDVGDIIDINNPYPVLLFLTVGLLAMQYAGTRIKLTGELSVFSRVLGAILGAVNANIVISLGKELIKKYTDQVRISANAAQISAQEATAFKAQEASVQALAPKGIALVMQDAPEGFFPESYWIWIGGAVVAIAAILLASHFTEKEIGTP
jgi:hypothetical protein